ncbi:MAG: hypothetical protein K5829_07010 [Treponema sp.]|nr:hypothetical protein [Treponema sp.]
MKKLSHKKSLDFLFVFFLLFITIIFWSCKTLPSGTKVRPLDLLEKDCGFYMAVPSNCDGQLIKRIIQNNVDNITENNSQMISERINTVYLGLDRHYKELKLYAAIDSTVPTKIVPKLLSKKNGWNTSEFIPNDSLSKYNVYTNGQLSMAFPSPEITCIGPDVKEMLTKYDKIHSIPEEEGYLEGNYSELDSSLYDWLDGASEEIRFFTGKPQAFLYILIGASLDLKLNSVKGTFVIDEKFPEQYILNLDFNFKSEKYLKAGKVLLGMTFGLTNSQVQVKSKNELIISGIKINKEQLYTLLVI